jgi:hypothetical protein
MIVSADTLTTQSSTDEAMEDSIPSKVDSAPLEEWEMIEPDPVFVAETKEEPIQMESPQNVMPQNEVELEEEFAAVEPLSVPDEIKIEEQESPEFLTPELKEEEFAEELRQAKEKEFKTLPELAEDVVAEQFDLTDEERDEIALNLAKKITQKAGDALDSDFKKEVDEEKDRLTYSLRIRGFKVTHNRAK